MLMFEKVLLTGDEFVLFAVHVPLQFPHSCIVSGELSASVHFNPNVTFGLELL